MDGLVAGMAVSSGEGDVDGYGQDISQMCMMPSKNKKERNLYLRWIYLKR